MEQGSGNWTDLERLKRLDNPEREAVMPHAPVLQALDLGGGMHVADVGAGLGYFSFPLAVAVRPEGRVLAVDPSPVAREELKRRLESAMVHNVEVRDGTAAGLPVADHTLDRVLWHALLHEVPDVAKACHEMHRILKRQGLWVVVDWKPEATVFGPAVEDRWMRDRMEHLVIESADFRVKEVFDSGPVTWGMSFERL